MGLIKGSAFDFGDQGLFYSALDFGCRVSKTGADNRTIIISALTTIAASGGGVLIIPQGISHTFNPAVDFPATANSLLVWELTGNKFKLYSNQTLSSELGDSISEFFSSAISSANLRLVDQENPIYTYQFKVYNNAGTPVISGSSWDLCLFMPGASTPTAAFSRSGTNPGRLFLFNGLDITGDLKVSGQVQSSKSIQAPATGTSIQISDSVQYLVLNHSATIAALTVTLPQNPQDGNVVKIFSRSIVTALTLAAGTGETIETGHTVTTIAALGSLEYIFNSSDSKWYRVR